MSVGLLAVCAVLTVTSLNAEAASLTTTPGSSPGNAFRTVQNKNFVDVIKEKLRRNNDDYANDHLDELKQHPSDTRRMINDTVQNEADDKIPDTEIKPATPTVDVTEFRSVMKDGTRKKKHERHVNRVHYSYKANPPTTNQTSKPIISTTERKTQGIALKSVPVRSNKIRMIPNKPPRPPQRSRKPNIVRTESVPMLVNSERPVRPNTLKIDLLQMRSPGLDRDIPSADQLDMAPARGAFIHNMRLKNKFCHRHVLWPEGPKYNSKGEAIMPAFDKFLYGNRSFFATSKPKIVLPRCCNCCKKSVLGCQ